MPTPTMPPVDTSVTDEDGPQPAQDPAFVEVEVEPVDAVEVPA